jgi:predicted permease
MLSFYAGAFIAFGLGLTGARLLFKRPGTDAVAIGFCCLFSNSLLLGIPITERAYGTAALAGNFAIISVHSPLLYTFGITLMEGVRSHGSGATLGRVAVNALSGILRTPLVLGILAGFVVNLSGLALHGSIWAAVDMMASAALPTALFGLGGVLFRYRPEGDMKAIGMVTVLSLIVHPAVTYGLGRWGFGLETSALRSAVVTASMAPGVNAYLFASMYGVAKRVAASSVLLATAASILTVWAWLAILP